jgi:hypothetical protein
MEQYGYRRTDEEVMEAIIQSKGIVSNAAKILGLLSAHSLRERIKKTPELLEVTLQQRELMKDSAESVIYNSIEIDKNVETAKWYMKSLGKDRGYSDSINVTGSIAVTPVDLSNLSMEEVLQLEQILNKTKSESTDSATS